MKTRIGIYRRSGVGLLSASLVLLFRASSPAQELEDPNVLIEKRTATLPAWAEALASVARETAAGSSR